MNTKTNIIVSLQVEGCHSWPGAFEKVSYLKERHRHMFHIKVEKAVSHEDRDIEIIEFKRKIKEFLISNWYQPTTEMLEFGSMSCESIAYAILNQYDCDKVEVTEDNENGAVVYKIS